MEELVRLVRLAEEFYQYADKRNVSTSVANFILWYVKERADD